MSESRGFEVLHKGVQRWIWEQQWTSLRDIQERAIEPILRADRDVIISAATASGKTEAAFLPACSHVATAPPAGIAILYISPLKALINDQYRRLRRLCEILDLPLTAWHGDVLRSVKEKQRKKPGGIILITPESLEALLLHHAIWCGQAFRELKYVIIDEFHAFLGSERGMQLQSLLHRVEFLFGRSIPRIALSATLSDLQHVAHFLRPQRGSVPCEIITSSAFRSDVKVQLRGYIQRPDDDEAQRGACGSLTNDLYRLLRGSSHLIFANSRARTEELAASLSDLCERDGVPNEFFPHHGNLSKELREQVEARLLAARLPTSAVCTMTLELGIDIGSVDSIAQISAAHSVAGMRQRLGRSGRRGDAAVLRLFIEEEEITARTHLIDRLRLQTVQSIAMVQLLLRKWCEPTPARQYHLSTLVQQTVSVIGQYGGVCARQLWSLLCESGPFSLVDSAVYAELLRCLGASDILTQTHDGLLVLGARGEKLVDHFSFYCAFNTPDEYRLEYHGKTLGTIPYDRPLLPGQLIIFGGQRWETLSIDAEKKIITLRPATGGRPPKFSGAGPMLHDVIRAEMKRVYEERLFPPYLNAAARDNLTEGFACYHSLGLGVTDVLQLGNTLHILSWRGDRVVNTITVLLRRAGLIADTFGGIIEIASCTPMSLRDAITQIMQNALPSPEELGASVADTYVDKHDSLLPKHLREASYGRRYFDVDGAVEWMKGVLNNER
ncbi:MAG: DEAD/DEAH box helicase [Bacteroidia bacterium]|nr:DEAD/DEAH box helicase [Bacteroidia bacterium]